MIKILKHFILLLIALTIGFFVGYNFPKKYEECTLEPSEYYYHCLQYESGKCLKIILKKYNEMEIFK